MQGSRRARRAGARLARTNRRPVPRSGTDAGIAWFRRGPSRSRSRPHASMRRRSSGRRAAAPAPHASPARARAAAAPSRPASMAAVAGSVGSEIRWPWPSCQTVTGSGLVTGTHRSPAGPGDAVGRRPAHGRRRAIGRAHSRGHRSRNVGQEHGLDRVPFGPLFREHLVRGLGRRQACDGAAPDDGRPDSEHDPGFDDVVAPPQRAVPPAPQPLLAYALPCMGPRLHLFVVIVTPSKATAGFVPRDGPNRGRMGGVRPRRAGRRRPSARQRHEGTRGIRHLGPNVEDAGQPGGSKYPEEGGLVGDQPQPTPSRSDAVARSAQDAQPDAVDEGHATQVDHQIGVRAGGERVKARPERLYDQEVYLTVQCHDGRACGTAIRLVRRWPRVDFGHGINKAVRQGGGKGRSVPVAWGRQDRADPAGRRPLVDPFGRPWGPDGPSVAPPHRTGWTRGAIPALKSTPGPQGAATTTAPPGSAPDRRG